MARDWNGADLVTEFSTQLGDTRTAFKSKVLSWINEISRDMAIRHNWEFLKFKGKKVLTASTEEQTLTLARPTAPTLAALAGGSLTSGSSYYVAVTYYESVAKVESVLGVSSAVIIPATTNLSITVSGIPVSSDPLVTSRKIYLSKDGGEFYYYSTLSDNTTTTTTITADTSSTELAPDYDYLKTIIGNPFFESGPNRQLIYKPSDQLRLLFQGSFSSGSPEFWSIGGEGKIILYPMPDSAYTLSFYYNKLPNEVYDSSTSQPDFPIWLKPVLKMGVLMLGAEYRDRADALKKRNDYESLLRIFISRAGAGIKTPLVVRDVMGNSDGWEL